MNSFSGRNAHHAATNTGIPANAAIHFAFVPQKLAFAFFIYSSPPQIEMPDSSRRSVRLFCDRSLEFPERRRAKIRVEPLAVNRNRRELAQIRPRRNFIV